LPEAALTIFGVRMPAAFSANKTLIDRSTLYYVEVPLLRAYVDTSQRLNWPQGPFPPATPLWWIAFIGKRYHLQSLLIISDRSEDISTIRTAFDGTLKVAGADNFTQAGAMLEQVRYDGLFVDLDILGDFMHGNDFSAAMESIRKHAPSMEIVVMSPPDRIRMAVEMVRQGAGNYVTYPISGDEVRLVVENLKRTEIRQSELDYLRDRFWKDDAKDVIQTRSPAMVAVFKKIRSVAATKTTVILTGETGTGKSILAKLIHQHSNRQKSQFISVHCGAIPDTLLESELFGHEKGAFTGAMRQKLGKFEIANGGTIFLDEIGTLTPQAQVKLLQVLQDGTFSRVGGDLTIHTNARVIAATNTDLKAAGEAGDFRKDLYYRLNVFPIHIPPLRERIEDLPQLIQLFLNRLNREFQKSISSVHPHVIQALANYNWPGNVRELENLMERAYILEETPVLTPEGFPQELFETFPESAILSIDTQMPLAQARRQALDDFERRYLKDLLTRHNGKINLSAAAAGITTRQLNKLMSHHKIRKETFKKNG
jgi:DNA-binding NtrC family response regulator